jgi:predicted nuclease of predicted toxin-antitoxin system
MTRFLADENFPGATVARIRKAGHDTEWIRTSAPGSDDKSILAKAAADRRILLTFDKDFGELAFRDRKSFGVMGIVLFRLKMSPPGTAIERVVATLTSKHDWSGYFWVIEPGRMRARPL